MGVELNNTLSVLLGILCKVAVLGAASKVTSEDVVTTRSANGRDHMLLQHEGTFACEAVEIGGQVFIFALLKAVEVVGEHIIGNKEDDVGALGVSVHKEAESSEGEESKATFHNGWNECSVF
jgi:hypothetical protein